MEFQSTVTDSAKSFRDRDAEQNRLDQLRDAYYKIYMHPDDCALVGSAAYVDVNNNTVVELTAAGSDAVRKTFIKPELWRKGSLSVIVYWSTDGTDVNTQRLKTVVRSVGLVDAVMANVDLLTQTEDIAPVAAAKTLYDDTWSTMTTSILNTHKVIEVVFQRLGSADSNGDKTYFLGLELEFLPENRQ